MTNISKRNKSFSRSDLILESKEWGSSVVAKINEEFDCDSKNDAIRKHSQNGLTRELNFADHVIPYAFTILKVTGLETTNLVRTIISKNMKGLTGLIKISYRLNTRLKQLSQVKY